MINLPTTVEEAEAIAFARAMLKQIETKHVEVLGAEFQFFDVEGSRSFLKEAAKAAAMANPSDMIRLVDDAQAGDRLADEALRELIMDHQHQSKPMPPHLSAYNIEVLAGKQFKAKPGRRFEDQFFRDIGIAILVRLVAEKAQIRPTRNPASREKMSACSIVANVLGMSEPAVVSIWTRVSASASIKPLKPDGAPL